MSVCVCDDDGKDVCDKKGFQVCRVSQIQIRWFRCISYVFISGALKLRLRYGYSVFGIRYTSKREEGGKT